MELARRDTDKKAKRTSLLIAVAIHLVIGIVFWNVGGGEIIKDIILDVVEGERGEPPPPPKPKVKQVQMKRPDAIKPKFDIKTATRVDPKFTPNFKVMATFDADVSTPDFTLMAQNYSVKTFSLDRSQISNVTSTVLDAIGVGDLMDDRRGIRVSGIGKRMRARLNLCLASTPGATIIGPDGFGDTLTTKAEWHYIFRKYNSIERARAWLKENTQIQVTENTITLNFENTYSDWIYNIRKKGALSVDSSSYYHENTALRRLEHAVYAMELNKISGNRDFIRLSKASVFSYITAKYEVKDAALFPADMVIKKIEERFILREWRKRGINQIIYTVNRLDPDMSKQKLIASLKPVYMFFRKAQALENPLVILANVVGLEKIARENMEILRTYVKNGGFIWIDDTGVATGNINNQHNVAQIFIHNLMAFDEKGAPSKREQETFNKLSGNDKNVQGFELGEPFPVFAHPQAFIPITIPRDVVVDVRIFNRLGIVVKHFSWTKENPMPAGSYIKKEVALAWNCGNNEGEPVESGLYFIQMQSGLFQRTRLLRVSKLRMLDEKHPLMGVVHSFRNVPVCRIENGSQFWETRTYGNASFGYYLKGRMCILYTEGAGVVAGLGDLNNPVAKDMASKFLNNIIAFCLSDEDGVAIRP